MANAAALAVLHKSIRSEDAQAHHILRIRFPVRDLLPNDTEPVLDPPTNIAMREAPPVDQRRLGISQSLCMLIIDCNTTALACGQAFNTSAPIDGISEILACGPGKSRLDAVVFHDTNQKQRVLRLSFQIALLQNHEHAQVYTFSMPIGEWNRVIEEQDSPWILAPDELITRSSPRAYYHVRNRLAFDSGQKYAVAEEAGWSARCGAKWLREQERSKTTVEDIEKDMEDMTL